MDKGIRLNAGELEEYLNKHWADPRNLFHAFDIENDGPYVWIHRVNAPLSANVHQLLHHFGYGIDLKPLQEEKKLPIELRAGTPCGCCNKPGLHVRYNSMGSLCYSCLCEMVIFYEMEKEKRDSRTTEVSLKNSFYAINWDEFADQRIIRNEGV